MEKILGSSADIDATLVERYYDLKHSNGYTYDSIERKRLSLEGVKLQRSPLLRRLVLSRPSGRR